MTRLTRGQFASLKLLIAGFIGADLFAAWVWATRPTRIYSDWLGLSGPRSDSPFSRVVNWAAWNDGPRTPSGLVALFDLGEFVFAAVLLFGLFLLIVFLLSPRKTETPMWRRMTVKIGALRFRMRTAVVLIAIIALYLSWEIGAPRTWRVRSEYLRKAQQAARGVESNLPTLREIREDRPDRVRRGASFDPARRDLQQRRAAAASAVAFEELKQPEVDLQLARLVFFTELKHKYEQAANDPWKPVAPDRPSPTTETAAAEWLHLGDYPRALAVYDELARAYPDLVEAHSRSAWLRATCPDALYRDGKRAVESAQRACELTHWQNPAEIEVLAAACAEAGDFGSAVKWQEKAVSLTADPGRVSACQKRLDVYREGKPFR
jgi:tetratricopeptide (TPR) repeat protein